MSVNKVVKVEDIDEVRTSPIDPFFHSVKSPESKTQSVVTFNEDKVSVREDGDGEEEKQHVPLDVAYPLPENWPRIPQLDGRRSCELTNSTLPCVNKAIYHLELVQGLITDWFKQAKEDAKSQVSSRRQSVQSIQIPVPPKKQLRFVDERELTPSKYSGSSSSISRLTAVATPESEKTLSVVGIGGKTDQEDVDINEEISIPYLGAEDVLEEVIVLLARLEKDRQEKDAEWDKEKQKVSMLTTKIDRLCLKRLKELPAIVQKEHEACILDLNELQWHVAYCSRSEDRIKDRKEIAEVLNARLKEDIAFVKKHIPLVQEKLLLELEAMNKIKNAQGETSNELEVTKQRQSKTEIKNIEANNKAETERGHIKQELDTVRDNLSQINDELTAAKMTHTAYIQQIEDIQNKVKSNTQELLILEVKRENACDSAEFHNNKVKELNDDIEKSSVEYNRLQNENIFLEKELNNTKNRISHDTSKMLATIKQLETKIRSLHLRNQEASMEIQDAQDKIDFCIKQKTADEKNMVRIGKEIERTETILKSTLDESDQLSGVNMALQEQLSIEEDKIFKTEEALKNAIEILTRQVKEEMHNRTVLQARINSDSTEIERTRIESAKKQEKAGKVAEDVDTAVNTVFIKVERLRSSKEENNQIKTSLTENIEETKKQHKESRDNFLQKLAAQEPQHAKLKEDLNVVNKKIDHMKWRSDVMSKGVEDMNASEGIMTRVVQSTEKAIKHHLEDMKECTIQLDTTKKIEADLTKSFNEVQDRITVIENTHTKLIEERKKVLKQTVDQKEFCLSRNRELAARYRKLQNEYVLTKDGLLNSYDHRVKLENSLTDLKQLQSLQKKMHGALTELYKLSGKYNDSELARMEIETSRNGAKVEELQDEMDRALKNITHFLQTQMDGTVAKKMAWDAIKKKEKSKKIPNSAGSQVTTVSA